MTRHENPIQFRNADPDTLITRRADIRPETFDEAGRTVEAVISTGADYPRRDARGAFTERLDLAAINVTELVGLPVLDGHRQAGSEHVVGTVTAARRDGPGIVATIRLSEAEDVRSAVTKVREGVLRGVSIGYRVTTWEDGTDASGGRVRTAKAWRIHEISLVSVPADTGAVVRSNDMPDIITDEPTAQTRAERRAQVRTIATSAGLTPEWADAQIDADADLTTVRAAAFEAMQRRSPRISTIGASNDDPAIVLARREEALAARVTGTAPSDEARQYVSDRLSDHAAAILHMRGESTRGMNAEAILTRAGMHTTSDFPNLLTGVGRRIMQPAYEAAASPIKALARQTTLPDFRAGSKLRLSEIGLLKKVNEAGEIRHTSRGESVESYALETYGSMFAISRKALINDDLGAFRDWGVAAGRAAAETEANLLVSLLTQASGLGPVMGDGKRLFHADHGNLATDGTSFGEAGDFAALSAARQAFREQKGADGKTPINAVPKFLVVSSADETAAEQELATIYPATSADTNPFAGKLTLLVEPRLPAGAWYLFADPAVLPALEYAYLSSAPGPQMASREGWDVLGMEFRVVLDFGAGAVDWRGVYRDPGS